MSWSFTVKSPMTGADASVAAAIAREKSEAHDNPFARRTLDGQMTAVREALLVAPTGVEVTVQSHGHFNNDGTGEASLKVGFAKPKAGA